jgi:hypothetical protein
VSVEVVVNGGSAPSVSASDGGRLAAVEFVKLGSVAASVEEACSVVVVSPDSGSVPFISWSFVKLGSGSRATFVC